jgi:hypothetical protein
VARAGIAKLWKPVINVTDLDAGEAASSPGLTNAGSSHWRRLVLVRREVAAPLGMGLTAADDSRHLVERRPSLTERRSKLAEDGGDGSPLGEQRLACVEETLGAGTSQRAADGARDRRIPRPPREAMPSTAANTCFRGQRHQRPRRADRPSAGLRPATPRVTHPRQSTIESRRAEVSIPAGGSASASVDPDRSIHPPWRNRCQRRPKSDPLASLCRPPVTWDHLAVGAGVVPSGWRATPRTCPSTVGQFSTAADNRRAPPVKPALRPPPGRLRVPQLRTATTGHPGHPRGA